jgi:DNA topoisomerase VI subunit B
VCSVLTFSTLLLPFTHARHRAQVITNIHSVIKELMENSLDAGATTIEVRHLMISVLMPPACLFSFPHQIRLEDCGLTRLVVQDNGCGISAEDAPCMAQRYFTSKLTAFSDLESLSTLGFRGEALNAICTVAQKVRLGPCPLYPRLHAWTVTAAAALTTV